MDGLRFIISHSALWIDFKSILALILFLSIVVFFAVRYHMVRKVEKGLEEEMEKIGTTPMPDLKPPVE